MIPGLHSIAQLAALRLVDSLLEGVCIAVFAAMVLRFARRQSSAVRFAICFSAMVAIALLPFFRISPPTATGAGHAAIALPESFAVYLFVAWGVIAFIGLLRLGYALGRLNGIRKSCVPLDLQNLDPVLQNTLAAEESNRGFTLCTSDRVRIPTAIGLVKPAIVVPRWVMHDLSPAELNQVLLHELAHLRRWDDWTNLAQQVVKALFFFHPAVWWIEKRISLEREMACDDAVLAVTSSPRAYAECLARLAEKTFVRRSLALAQAALGKVRHTSLRIAQILKIDRPARVARSWKPAAALVAGFAIACGAAISQAPSLIAFQSSQPTQAKTAVVLQSGPAPDVSNFAHAANFKVSARPAPMIPAKLRVRSQHPNQKTRVLNVKSPSRPQLPPAVHLTSSQDRVLPFTETLFFVVEDATGTSGQVYRIQLLRVIVFHPADESAAHAPAKQT